MRVPVVLVPALLIVAGLLVRVSLAESPPEEGSEPPPFRIEAGDRLAAHFPCRPELDFEQDVSEEGRLEIAGSTSVLVSGLELCRLIPILQVKLQSPPATVAAVRADGQTRSCMATNTQCE